jgi:hypothetical protein
MDGLKCRQNASLSFARTCDVEFQLYNYRRRDEPPWFGRIFMPRYNSVPLTLAWLSLSPLCAVLPAPAIAQSASDNVIHLNQAWSQDDRVVDL